MWDYIIAILGFVILFALKIYLSYRANENKKFLYENPHELANAILVKKKREMGDMLQKIYDPNQLNLLLVRNLTVLNAECKFCKWANSINMKKGRIIWNKIIRIAEFLVKEWDKLQSFWILCLFNMRRIQSPIYSTRKWKLLEKL